MFDRESFYLGFRKKGRCMGASEFGECLEHEYLSLLEFEKGSFPRIWKREKMGVLKVLLQTYLLGKRKDRYWHHRRLL